MRQRSVAAIGCAAGLLGGVGIALLCGAAERSTTDGRYQLHVWTTEGGTNGSGTCYNPEHGAYRIDTQTGEVYAISANNGMQKVGS